MKLINAIIIALISFTLIATPVVATAAAPEDVVKIVTCMQAHNCKHTLATKSYGDHGEDGEQIVFVNANKRYTLYWSGDMNMFTGETESKERQFLSVWVRPEGTQGREAVNTFSDHMLDGSVNFGISGNPSAKKLLDDDADGLPVEGLEHTAYWQTSYDEAIAAAVKRLL